jgi:hypothetical protein
MPPTNREYEQKLLPTWQTFLESEAEKERTLRAAGYQSGYRQGFSEGCQFSYREGYAIGWVHAAVAAVVIFSLASWIGRNW